MKLGKANDNKNGIGSTLSLINCLKQRNIKEIIY